MFLGSESQHDKHKQRRKKQKAPTFSQDRGL